MKPFSASLVNIAVLVGVGIWDYFATDGLSLTSLMPIGGGLVLLALNGGLRRENMLIAHIVVLITLIIVIILAIPLVSSIGKSAGMTVLRISLMMLSGILAMVFFIRSFIQARKNR